MKYLILVLIFISCTKQKQDFNQTFCANCLTIKQIWVDSAVGFIRADTGFNGTLCGEQLINFKNANQDYWVKICDPKNESGFYWEHVINKTY